MTKDFPSVSPSIFLIAGAPAVGKSSTAHQLAAHYPKSIHIPVDDLRDMVVSGLVYPGADWSPGLVEQLQLARGVAVEMALRYRRAGFVVTLDDFWDSYSRLQEYQTLEQVPGFHKILLYPNRQAAESRNQQRAGPGEGNAYIDAGIRTVYAQLEREVGSLEREGWILLDTSQKDLAATVKHILALTDPQVPPGERG